MPRIWDTLTGIAVYIYGSLNEAEHGLSLSGAGSGFVVEVNHETNEKHSSLYVVTNEHVVRKAGTPVIRFNRKDGVLPAECLPTQRNEWKTHQDADDIAVFPLDYDWRPLLFNSVNLNQFVTPQMIIDEDIGIGDDTVMVGRFIDHDGGQRNAPSVRFGNIAMMNKEKIHNDETGIDQESFLVETRSLPGYSGSAVLLWSPCAMNGLSARRGGKEKPGPLSNDLNKAMENFQKIEPFLNPKGPYLLGIDWCHLQSKAYVVMPHENGSDKRHPDNWFVRQNSGMAGVIPAWKIADVLKCEELMNKRREQTESNNRKSGAVSLDSADRAESAMQKTEKGLEIPVPTESQFFDDLRKASRKK
jgi:Trypsin-like peptidase domain